MHISEEDKMIFACISTLYMLLAPAYAVEALLQLCVELNKDGTSQSKQQTVYWGERVMPMWVLTPWHGGQVFCKNARFNSQENMLLKLGFEEVVALGQKFRLLVGSCPGWETAFSDEICFQCKQAPPPRPSFVSGGLWNRSSTHWFSTSVCLCQGDRTL